MRGKIGLSVGFDSTLDAKCNFKLTWVKSYGNVTHVLPSSNFQTVKLVVSKFLDWFFGYRGKFLVESLYR